MRYLGGKNRQGQRILEAIVERGVGTSTWVEPFMGGANMSVKAAKVFDALVLSDIDTGLVEMFRAGVNGWVPRVRYPSKSEYDELKVSDQADPFAAFCSFAASYRGKKWGGYGAIGSGRDYYAESRRAFIKDIAILREVNHVISAHDYTCLIPSVLSDGAVIYCDPPYAGTTGYSFGWDSRQFWRWADSIANAGFDIFVSEYSAPDGWGSILDVPRKATVDHSSKAKFNVERLFTRF